MFLIVLGVAIFIWGAYYGIKSLYVQYTTPEKGDNMFASSYFGSYDVFRVLLRIAAQIMAIAIVIEALTGEIKDLLAMIVFQGFYAIIVAAMETFTAGEHLEWTEGGKVEGKYDVKWDPKRNTAEVSEHYEPPFSFQNFLAFPFRLVHNFCVPVAVLIFEYALRKKYKENEEAYYKKRFKK